MKWFQKNTEDASPRLLSLSPIRNYDSGDPDYSAERYYHLPPGPRRSRLGTYYTLYNIYYIYLYTFINIFHLLCVLYYIVLIYMLGS